MKKREEARLREKESRQESNLSAVLANEMNKAKELEDMKLKTSRVQNFANQPEE